MKKLAIIIAALFALVLIGAPSAASASDSELQPDPPYVLVAWEMPSNGTDWPQNIVGTVLLTVGSLDPALFALDRCATDYQLDLYRNDDITAALIAGGVLYGPQNPAESFAHGAVPGDPWVVLRADEAFCTPLPDDTTETSDWTVPTVTCDNKPGDELPTSREATVTTWTRGEDGNPVSTVAVTTEHSGYVVTEDDIESLECAPIEVPLPNPVVTYGDWSKAVWTCDNAVGDVLTEERSVSTVTYTHGDDGQPVAGEPVVTTETREYTVTESDIEALECATVPEPEPNPGPTVVTPVEPEPTAETQEKPFTDTNRAAKSDITALPETGTRDNGTLAATVASAGALILAGAGALVWRAIRARREIG